MTTNLLRNEMNTTALTSSNNQDKILNVGVDNSNSTAMQRAMSPPDFAASIEARALISLANSVYPDILGRPATSKEMTAFVNTITANHESVYSALHKVVYTQEAYNRIAQMDKAMLGYDVNNDTISAQQEKLCQVTRSTGWASSGHTGNTTITYTPQYTMSDIRNDFAFSPSVREAVVNMLTNMGVNPSEQDITWSQDRFAEGRSYQSVLSENAHGYHGDYASKELLQKIYGRSATDSDTAWLNMVKDQLAGGKSYQQILSENT